jgi:WXG100 family type VII secretion target
MAQGYQTGAPELLKAAQDINTANDELQGLLNTLLGKLEPLESAWQGRAAKAFHTLLERYAHDAKQLNDSLVKIGEQVTGTAHTYTQQEEEQEQTLSKLTQALNP